MPSAHRPVCAGAGGGGDEDGDGGSAWDAASLDGAADAVAALAGMVTRLEHTLKHARAALAALTGGAKAAGRKGGKK